MVTKVVIQTTISRALVALALGLVLGLGFVGCGDDEASGPEVVAQFEAVCEGGAGGGELAIERHISSLGPSAHEMAFDGQGLWVVESGANRVSRFDVEDQTMESGALDVGAERNPYDLAIDEEKGRLWVTNFLSDTVSVFDGESRELVEELDYGVFENPSSVVIHGDYAYVGSVNYQGSQGFGPGSIAVIDRQSLELKGEVETVFRNPHFMAVHEIGGRAHLVVSSSGELDQSGDRVRVEGSGGLEIFDLDEGGMERVSFAMGQAEVETVGAPGKTWLNEERGRLYMVSGIAPALFVFDVEERVWIHDALDPLWLVEDGEEHGDATHRAALDEEGLLWVTSFNDDELHVIDTACDRKVTDAIDLGEAAHMLEGAQAIEVIDRGERREIYYARSIANAMGRLLYIPHGDSDE